MAEPAKMPRHGQSTSLCSSTESGIQSSTSSTIDEQVKSFISHSAGRWNMAASPIGRIVSRLCREQSSVEGQEETPSSPNISASPSLLRQVRQRMTRKKTSCPSLLHHQGLLSVDNDVDDDWWSSSDLRCKSPPCPSLTACVNGGERPLVNSRARYKLLTRVSSVQLCRVVDGHSNVIGKIVKSKLLRRWETHTVLLDEEGIVGEQPCGALSDAIRYTDIEDLHALADVDTIDRHYLRVHLPRQQVLTIQTSNAYARNEWLHSIEWRRQIARFRRQMALGPRVNTQLLLPNLIAMVTYTVNSPLQDEALSFEPIVAITPVLQLMLADELARVYLEPCIEAVAPLLDNVPAVAHICGTMSEICVETPHSLLVEDVFADVAHETLKRNVDLAKYPAVRAFVVDFVLALNERNNADDVLRRFAARLHTRSSQCPHAHTLGNIVGVCLSAVQSILADDGEGEEQRSVVSEYSDTDTARICLTAEQKIVPGEFDDWRPSLCSLLQPLPFPDRALSSVPFARRISRIVQIMSSDVRCDVHLCVLPVRQGKEGWLHVFCPGGRAAIDDGTIFVSILDTLLACSCRRKRFLQSLNAMQGPLELLALRQCHPAIQALCHMLELDVVEGVEEKKQIIASLSATAIGRTNYSQLCDRQTALAELQQKGGPRKLTLPSKSTDSDLAVLLSSGSFGNLEWLSLAFTNVTSACADYLIRLPSLRYLNLWSTSFNDKGLYLISEHLLRLQVLNLCETPVTDAGIRSLTALRNLRKLNLNSTQLSSDTFQELRSHLPCLQEMDVRYTEAWCVDDGVVPPPAQKENNRSRGEFVRSAIGTRIFN